MTSSLLPVKPFDDKQRIQPTVEVQEFIPSIPEAVHPYMVYTNNLYVYPLSLNFNSQKFYSKVSDATVYRCKRAPNENGDFDQVFVAIIIIIINIDVQKINRDNK